MPATPQELFAFLDSLGIVYRTVTHPPLFTVAESQKLRGTIPGAHTKNLLLRDKRDTVVLAVALENAVIDLKGLHRLLGASRFSFASAAVMRVSPATVSGTPRASLPWRMPPAAAERTRARCASKADNRLHLHAS